MSPGAAAPAVGALCAVTGTGRRLLTSKQVGMCCDFAGMSAAIAVAGVGVAAVFCERLADGGVGWGLTRTSPIPLRLLGVAA